MLFMGKSTISMAILIAMLIYEMVYPPQWHVAMEHGPFRNV